MKWKTNDTGDSSCPGGYKKTNKTQAQCNYVPENPPTGDKAILFTWIAAIVAITCSVWYLKKSD